MCVYSSASAAGHALVKAAAARRRACRVVSRALLVRCLGRVVGMLVRMGGRVGGRAVLVRVRPEEVEVGLRK